jgi:hypothetical protein
MSERVQAGEFGGVDESLAEKNEPTEMPAIGHIQRTFSRSISGLLSRPVWI